MNCISNNDKSIDIPDADDIACAREDADDAASLHSALTLPGLSDEARAQLHSLLARKIRAIRITLSR